MERGMEGGWAELTTELMGWLVKGGNQASYNN